jgi:hypothetical protein
MAATTADKRAGKGTEERMEKSIDNWAAAKLAELLEVCVATLVLCISVELQAVAELPPR